MSSKLPLLAALVSITLVACSGSTAGQIGPFASPDADPPAEAGDEPSPTTSSKPSARLADSGELAEQDAAPDTGAPDSSTPPDSGPDADAAPPTPRYGLAFVDAADESFVADLPAPYQAGGQSQATWEGWFRHDGFPPNVGGQNGRLFDAGYNVGCHVVTPDPDATEAGKVQCDLFGQTGIRSASKPVGWFHLALTFSSGVFRLYLDGQEAGSAVVNEASLRAEPMEGDLVRGGKFFFGATYRDSSSGRTSVDEFRFSPTARYNGPFAPQKHLDASGADLLLLLDDGAGSTADSGKARLRNVAWTPVSR